MDDLVSSDNMRRNVHYRESNHDSYLNEGKPPLLLYNDNSQCVNFKLVANSWCFYNAIASIKCNDVSIV